MTPNFRIFRKARWLQMHKTDLNIKCAEDILEQKSLTNIGRQASEFKQDRVSLNTHFNIHQFYPRP